MAGSSLFFPGAGLSDTIPDRGQNVKRFLLEDGEKENIAEGNDGAWLRDRAAGEE